MSDLKARINTANKVIEFSGSGTFQAKEAIKSLGNARWIHDRKVWQISPKVLPLEELERLFPGIEVEAVGEDVGTVSHEDISLEKSVNTFGVGEIVSRVRGSIYQVFPTSILVFGVLSSVKEHRDRVFMDLSDKDNRQERLNCVIWGEVETITAGLRKAGFALEPDLQVMFEVRVDLNRKDGRLTLRVLKIVEEYTVAKLAAQRELTNQKLKEEGLFAKNKGKRLPFLPKRLGVLTSGAGTVINDFRNSLDQAEFPFEIFWVQVSVQGVAAKNSIIRGIKLLTEGPNLDAILIFRGGGSAAELSVFNEYEVAKEICLCPYPVVSAIGHQEDQSSVQDVSAIALGVPKDIGRYFADIIIDYRRRFNQAVVTIALENKRQIEDSSQRFFVLHRNLTGTSRQVIDFQHLTLSRVSDQLAKFGHYYALGAQERVKAVVEPIVAIAKGIPRERTLVLRQIVEKLISMTQKNISAHQMKIVPLCGITRGAEQFLERIRLTFEQVQQAIQLASPEVQLSRGYVLVERGDDLVTRAQGLKKGEGITLRFQDGRRKAIVDK